MKRLSALPWVGRAALDREMNADLECVVAEPSAHDPSPKAWMDTSHADKTPQRIPRQRSSSRAVGSKEAEPAEVFSRRSSVAKKALAAIRPL